MGNTAANSTWLAGTQRRRRRVDAGLPAAHPGQREVDRCPARFRVLACGRRWGKSMLAVTSCLRETSRPGRVAWYVAPTFRMADLHWRVLKRHLPRELGARVLQSERRVELPGGSEIAFRSADNPDHLRGAGLDFLVVDEAAFIPDAGAVWAEALRPTLSDRLGRALIISTPRGRDWFCAMWQRGQLGDDPELVSFRFPTASNPLIAPAEIAAAQRELPQRVFAQEYEAAFLDDGGSIFRQVAGAATAPLAPLPYPGRFVVGVDWGKRNDFTVLIALDADAGQVVAVDRFNEIDYAVQTRRLGALCARWRPRLVLAEQNSIGEPLLEQLQRDGLPAVGFKTTAASKKRVIENLQLAFETAAITIPPEPALVAELEAYTLERTRAGNFRYNAPAGLHDDCVMALALAWEAREQSLGYAESLATLI